MAVRELSVNELVQVVALVFVKKPASVVALVSTRVRMLVLLDTPPSLFEETLAHILALANTKVRTPVFVKAPAGVMNFVEKSGRAKEFVIKSARLLALV